MLLFIYRYVALFLFILHIVCKLALCAWGLFYVMYATFSSSHLRLLVCLFVCIFTGIFRPVILNAILLACNILVRPVVGSCLFPV